MSREKDIYKVTLTGSAGNLALLTFKFVAGVLGICLFGCGGDRDKTKRPEMGAVAGRLADRIFITSDNSRTERTEDIIEDIKRGLDPAALAKTVCIADRREAIRTALLLAPKGATVLLAGKGHETYQILGTVKNHFDEREIVLETFKTLESC